MKFDIGICSYNDEQTIGRLLKILLTENYLHELDKIYVVCSGCTDRTEAIVKSYSTKFPNVILIHEDKRYGKPSAINKILSKELAPILVFIAADNYPKKGSIDKLLANFQQNNVGGVNGHPIPLKGFKYNTILWILHHFYCIYEEKTDKLQHLTGEFCAFKPTFSAIPLNIINDDVWIAKTLKSQGFSIVYEPEAISYFKSPANIFEYIKQRTRILSGHVQEPQRTLFGNILSEPIYTLKIVISALREINFLHFLYIAFLEIYIRLKSKFYKKGVFWDKVK
ncbi:MAG: glycosyltransferase [Candidatus Helarchaeota archaeon]